MRVLIDEYNRMVLGILLNSRYGSEVPISHKEELFTIEPGVACEVSADALNELFKLICKVSCEPIFWQIDPATGSVFKLQESGEKWHRDLNIHLGCALTLSNCTKLWQRG